MCRTGSWRLKALVAFLVSLNVVGCGAEIYLLFWQLISDPPHTTDLFQVVLADPAHPVSKFWGLRRSV